MWQSLHLLLSAASCSCALLSAAVCLLVLVAAVYEYLLLFVVHLPGICRYLLLCAALCRDFANIRCFLQLYLE